MVVNDGGAEVGELADSTEFVVVNANERRCFCAMSQYNIIKTVNNSPSSIINKQITTNSLAGSYILLWYSSYRNTKYLMHNRRDGGKLANGER